ncbi:MAG: Glyoxalase/bleomycin resistance protein/dioxygenase [Candidatus Gottesmanbacteria bacterium GW2011_GWA1_43_11]|uniref:Glyoxalase/bleomycin resistance protein/dioxygenase n=1 Tax=Candidatus Gottesmanbacteria bacterium GW2011_GWA1_43_11 TaxID=1618436 RepID=A0A0G1CKW2_9BACT|nr:MAG: Glyoxalase/bleomycin resistance protein/dioxygenase [Candidatus Gottesmanbacteria bacterium GW2011_GWA1_43_11]
MKMNPVVHFEMPYTDAKRVSEFYKSVFGWGMEGQGSQMGDYILAMTTDIDKKTQRPKEPGAINGGFYPKNKTYGGIHFVISVDNLEKHIEIIRKAGGRISGKPMDIPGVGKFVMCKDTEGNPVGMLQPSL